MVVPSMSFLNLGLNGFGEWLLGSFWSWNILFAIGDLFLMAIYLKAKEASSKASQPFGRGRGASRRAGFRR